MRTRLITLGGLTAMAALAGCSKPDLAPIPAPSPSARPPASPRSLPPATHRWRIAAVKCPDLTSAAAGRLKIAGTATQVDASGDDTLGRTVDCRWGPDDFSALSMTVRLIVATQAGADAAWQFTSANLGNPKPLTGVGEQAFVSDPADGRGIQVDVRSGNATATLHLIPSTGSAGGTAPLRAAAPELAADVLDGLVPA